MTATRISEAELIEIENRLLKAVMPRVVENYWGATETVYKQETADVKRLLEIVRESRD